MQQNESKCGLNVVLYARVSSKEQEQEGYSIPAQLDLLHNHARQRNLTVLQEFVDIESASVTGRTNFGLMLAFVKKNGSRCKTILVEKTDRLYRNLRDYSIVDEFGVEVHLVKENKV